MTDTLHAKLDALSERVTELVGAVGELRGEVKGIRDSQARRWHPAAVGGIIVGSLAAVGVGASRILLALSAGGFSVGAASPDAIAAAAAALAAKEEAAHRYRDDRDVEETAPAGSSVARQ